MPCQGESVRRIRPCRCGHRRTRLKVIRLDEDGMVADFVMNGKCAAGTSRFLGYGRKAACRFRISEVSRAAQRVR